MITQEERQHWINRWKKVNYGPMTNMVIKIWSKNLIKNRKL